MEKVVVCKFQNRSKKLKFKTNAVVADLLNLQTAFLSAADSDPHLAKLLDENDFVFQTHDPDFNVPVDIDVDEVIKDKSIVMVSFLPRNNPSDKANEKTDTPVVVDLDTPILQFNSLEQLTDHVAKHGGLASTSSKENDPEAGCSKDLQECPMEEDQDDDNKSVSQMSDSDSDCGPTDTKEGGKIQKPRVPYPYKLPSVEGTLLENYTSRAEIVQHLDKFVRVWATDLCKITQGKPLPKDYGNYARSIIHEHPFLGSSVTRVMKDGDKSPVEANHRFMAEKLSACVRRRRNYVKSLVVKKAKKDSPRKKLEGSTSPRKKILSTSPKKNSKKNLQEKPFRGFKKIRGM